MICSMIWYWIQNLKMWIQNLCKLEVILGTLVEEDHVTLQFRNHVGYSIPIKMHIFLSSPDDDSERVLQGINQILS